MVDLADQFPCGQALREEILDKTASVSGVGWCAFDIAGGAVISKVASAGKTVAKTLAKNATARAREGVESAKKIFRACKNCFEGGTLVQSEKCARPIESIQVGQRVLANPRSKRSSERTSGDNRGESGGDGDSEGEPAIHPSTWRTIVFILEDAVGRSEITLLRPLDWMEQEKIQVGGMTWVDMPEMSCVGWANVESIRPCPAIEPGEGRVVTATFHHSHGQVIDVQIEGQDRPIGATAAHPFWSEDRKAFVPTSELIPGERLLTLTGPVRVKSISPRGPPEPVYNLEVAVDHTYFVGELGTLVHNASGCRVGAKRGPKTNPHAPHNDTIKVQGDLLEAGGNKIVAGGGRLPEKLIDTPGGVKGGRRPDILFETPGGQIRGINVGKTTASGNPVKREVDALSDLNGPGGIPTGFVPYD